MRDARCQLPKDEEEETETEAETEAETERETEMWDSGGKEGKRKMRN